MGRYLLGIDNGLSVVKAVVFDEQGNEIGKYATDIQYENSGGDFVESDMDMLWSITSRVIGEAVKSSGVDPEGIAAVGNSAAGNGLYIVDKDGRPFCNAVQPMDRRAAHIINEWKNAGVEEEIFNYTTQNLWAGQPAPILKWLKLRKPAIYKNIGKIMSYKDWIKFKLTGEHTSDYSDVSSAGLLDNKNMAYNNNLFELYGIPGIIPCLPRVFKSHEVIGTVTGEASRETGLIEGTPVVSGMFDVDACCLGSGVSQPGICCIVAGTWSINASISQRVTVNKSIVQSTVFADGNSYLNIDSGPTSAFNLKWFISNVLGKNPEDGYSSFDKIISRYKPEDVSIIYLPYLYSPIRHPDLNASFIGMKASHGREDLLRAVYEGIALGHRENVEALKKCGLKNNKARFTGGAANSEEWCRIFSDVLGMEIETVQSKQPGALGAALAAGIGAGIYNSYEDAISKAVRIDSRYIPNKKNVKIYDDKYIKFNKLLELLTAL